MSQIERIPGFFAFGEMYARAVETAVNGDTLVEIGVFCGRSLAWLAQRAHDQAGGVARRG